MLRARSRSPSRHGRRPHRRRRFRVPAWSRTGLVGQQQRVAGHLGVGLLRLAIDPDLALEDAMRRSVMTLRTVSGWRSRQRRRDPAPWSRRNGRPSRLTPRSLNSQPSPRPPRTSWRTSLPPVFMKKSVSFAFLPSVALIWPRCVTLSGCSWNDQPGDFGIVAHVKARRRGDQRLAGPVWRSTKVALAPAPTARESAHASARRPGHSAVRLGARSSAPAAMSTGQTVADERPN
jgi:hypothetical protein